MKLGVSLGHCQDDEVQHSRHIQQKIDEISLVVMHYKELMPASSFVV